MKIVIQIIRTKQIKIKIIELIEFLSLIRNPQPPMRSVIWISCLYKLYSSKYKLTKHNRYPANTIE